MQCKYRHWTYNNTLPFTILQKKKPFTILKATNKETAKSAWMKFFGVLHGWQARYMINAQYM